MLRKDKRDLNVGWVISDMQVEGVPHSFSIVKRRCFVF